MRKYLAFIIAVLAFFNYLFIAIFQLTKVGAVNLWKWLRVSSKNFPELVTLPICIVALLTYPYLLEYSGVNAIFEYFHADPDKPDRSIKAFQVILLSLIYVFLANAASYAAIKYNRRDLWELYTQKLELEQKDLHSAIKDLRFYWACYFIGVLVAVYLAHSLILV
jgi:hypothetical protein